MTDISDTSDVTASPVRASRTYVSDHVWMMDVPDAVLRLWLTLRAYIYDKDPAARTVRITDAELATLMHRTVSAVRSIRRRAYALGLLAEHSVIQESYRGADGRHLVRTVRRIEVLHLDPPEGYDGPTNCYAELRRIRDVSAGHSGCQKSDTQNDQGKRGDSTIKGDSEQPSDQGKQDVSAGHSECHFFDRGRQNFDRGREKNVTRTPVDQGKRTPQVSLQVSSTTSQPVASRTDVTSAASPAGLAGREKEQGVEQGADGRDKAAAVLASLPVRTPLPTSTVRDLTPHVAALLASGWAPGDLTEHLTSGLPSSYGPGLIVQRVRDTRPRVRPPAGGSGCVLPACGTCGAREGEPPSVRTVDVIDDDGRLRARRCPDCRGTDTHAQGVRRRHLYAIP